jgi:uncharacterized protein (TIGR02594 family)
MMITAVEIGRQFIGTHETPGLKSTPIILAMLQLDTVWPESDTVAWCSAFVNFIAWLLGLPRSRSLAARSWLAVGTPVTAMEATVGFDVVVLQRGDGIQPGADVIAAPGHVGFFAGWQGDHVLLLAGNQGDAVSIAAFPRSRILGIRRLA